MLESCCHEFNDVLKNPFKGIQGSETSDKLLMKLGSSDKILGVLQCYDYFAPLSNRFKSSFAHLLSRDRPQAFKLE